MFKKLILAFAVLALAVASAGTVPGTGTNYKVTLTSPSVVNGTVLQAGDYRLTILDSKVKLTSGRQTVEAAAKVESVDKKFETTTVCYKTDGAKQEVFEIRLRGTKTKVVFNP